MDAVVEWPGGVKMQLYWHFTPPSYEALQSVPENRIYVSPVTVLFAPVDSDDRRTAVVKFPGGYVAEIHSALRR